MGIENYICVNCKCIFEYTPYACPNCERKTFELTHSSMFDTDKISERRDYLVRLEEKNRILTEALQKILEEIPNPSLPITHIISFLAKEAIKKTV